MKQIIIYIYLTHDLMYFISHHPLPRLQVLLHCFTLSRSHILDPFCLLFFTFQVKKKRKENVYFYQFTFVYKSNLKYKLCPNVSLIVYIQ